VKKVTIWSLVIVMIISMVTMFSLAGCAGETAEVAEEPAAEEPAAEEPAAEEPAAEEPAAEGKPFEGVTLNVVNMLGWAVTEPVWAYLDEFKEETGIEVVLNEMPGGDLRTKQLLEGETGSGAYDVIQIYDSGMPALSKIVIPLDEYLEGDYGSIDAWKENVFKGIYEQVIFDEAIMFNPFMAGTQICFYRKDLFEDPAEQEAFKAEYGYDLAAPSTKEELVDIAKFFTRDNQWGLIMPGKDDHGSTIFEMQMFDVGSGYTDENGELLWPKDRDKLIDVAQFCQDLVMKYEVVPKDLVTYAHPEMMEQYLSGNAAMVVSWLHDYWGTVTSDEVIDRIGETGTFVFPSDGPGKGGYVGPWGWGISKDSANKDAAWEFIKWFNSPEMCKKMISEGEASCLPPIKEVAEWGAENGYVPPATAESGETATKFVYLPELDLMREAIRPPYQELLIGGITAEQFIDRCIEAFEGIMNQ